MDSRILNVGLAITLAAGALAAVSPARANLITFSTAPSGDGFTGPVTEDGFTYSTLSGGLYVNRWGDPGQDMEGNEGGGGGVLNIVSATSLDFYFTSLDYSAYNSLGTGTQTLTVSGYLGGVLEGTDTYILANTTVFNPSYDNWTLEGANNLAGVKIDDLQITLNAGFDVGAPGAFQESIDNVDLSSVPEPAAWAMLLAGFAGLGLALRARRRLALI
jgi:hypothetical protein